MKWVALVLIGIVLITGMVACAPVEPQMPAGQVTEVPEGKMQICIGDAQTDCQLVDVSSN